MRSFFNPTQTTVIDLHNTAAIGQIKSIKYGTRIDELPDSACIDSDIQALIREIEWVSHQPYDSYWWASQCNVQFSYRNMPEERRKDLLDKFGEKANIWFNKTMGDINNYYENQAKNIQEKQDSRTEYKNILQESDVIVDEMNDFEEDVMREE